MKRAALFPESDSDEAEAAVHLGTHSNPLQRPDRSRATVPEPGWQQARHTMTNLFAANDALAQADRPAAGRAPTSTVEHLFRYGVGPDSAVESRARDRSPSEENAGEEEEQGIPSAYETLMHERVQAYHGDVYKGTCTAAVCVARAAPAGPLTISSRAIAASGTSLPALLVVLSSTPSAPPPSTPVLCRLVLSPDLAVSLSEDNPQYVHVLDSPAASAAPQTWWSLMFATTAAATAFFVACLVTARCAASSSSLSSLSSSSCALVDGETLWQGAVQGDGTALRSVGASRLRADVDCTVWPLTTTATAAPCLGSLLWRGPLQSEDCAGPALARVWGHVQASVADCRGARQGSRRVFVATGDGGAGDHAAPALVVVYMVVQLRVEESGATGAAPLALTAPPSAAAASAPHAPLVAALLQALSHAAPPAATAVAPSASARPLTDAEASLLFLRERVEALHDKFSRLDVDARLAARNAELVTQVKQLVGLAPAGPVEVEDAVKDRDALLAAVERHKNAAQEARRDYERALESIGRYSEQVRALHVDVLTQKEASTAREGELNERHRLLSLEARTRHQSELDTSVQKAYERGLEEGVQRGRAQAYAAQLDAETDGTAARGGADVGGLGVAMRKRLQAAEDAAAQSKLAVQEAKLHHEQDRRALRAEIAVLQQLCEKLKHQAGDPQIPEEDASVQVKRLKRALNAVYTNTERKLFARVDNHAPALTGEDLLSDLASAVREESKVFAGEIRAQADQRQRENTLLRQLMDDRRATARLAAATAGPPPPPFASAAPTAAATASSAAAHGASAHTADRDTQPLLAPPRPSTPPVASTAGTSDTAPADVFPARTTTVSTVAPSSLTRSTVTTPRPTVMTAPATNTATTARPPLWPVPSEDGATSPEPLSPCAVSPPPPPLVMGNRTPTPDKETEETEAVAGALEASPPLFPSSAGATAERMAWSPFTQPPPPAAQDTPSPRVDTTGPLWVDEATVGEEEEEEEDITPPRRLAIQLTP